MQLTDKEILELDELCNACVEDNLTPEQHNRLEKWLEESELARQYYVRYMDMSANLYSKAAENQCGDLERMLPHQPRWQFWRWLPTVVSIAAILVLGLLFIKPSDKSYPDQLIASSTLKYVAKITGLKNTEWANPTNLLPLGMPLKEGQTIEVRNGHVEVTFDSGAKIRLEGPAVFTIDSVWNATLLSGTLTASVPPQAIGFKISNPIVDVLDLGTEFSMISDPSGTTEVFVLEGEIEATSKYSTERESLFLKELESRKFERSGVSMIENPAEKFAHFNTPVYLQRYDDPINWIVWSFNDNSVLLPSASVNIDPIQTKLIVLDNEQNEVNPSTVIQIDELNQSVIQFDGGHVAKAYIKGISGDQVRTIAFWVKIPDGAILSSAYAMVAWRADGEKLNSRPIHIAWNRNPSEGPIGALRTDFSGGYAIANTNLRDGKWHHIAVAFYPSNDPKVPVQIKQYVNGRLESNSIIPGIVRSIGANTFASQNPLKEELKDFLWLGTRLGNTGPRKEHFVGSMDELHIADRSLAPFEIVELMNSTKNHP